METHFGDQDLNRTLSTLLSMVLFSVFRDHVSKMPRMRPLPLPPPVAGPFPGDASSPDLDALPIKLINLAHNCSTML